MMKSSNIALAMVVVPFLAHAHPNPRVQRGMDRHIPAHQHHSHPNIHADLLGEILAKSKNTEYSSNWAGAVLQNTDISPTVTFTSVVATMTVPVPTSSGTAIQASSAWVGIDGFINTGAILQAGIDIIGYEGNGYYDAWYEWYPDNAIEFDIEINAGDIVIARVYSTSDLTGVAIIENETTGQAVTTTVDAPKSTATLTGQTVEWIVEDFQEDGSLVDFLNFGTVEFTGAIAGATNTSFDLSKASVIDIINGSSLVAEATIVSNSELTVRYV